MNEEKRLFYLDQMGIQAWVSNKKVLEQVELEQDEVIQDKVFEKSTSQQTAVDLDALRQEVSKCTLCDLHRTRTQTVFGAGHPAAEWLIIGEAPGADEDRMGEPFVGRAGQLLTNMLRAMGLAREEVFIANILKCRPPNNRDPKPEEVNHCGAYLRQQIELIQPKIILVVGRIAAQSLLDTDTPNRKNAWQTILLSRYKYSCDSNIPSCVLITKSTAKA